MTVGALSMRFTALLCLVLLLFAATTVAPPQASAAADPTAVITLPATGQTYAVGQVITTGFSCSDPTGPGIATCLDSNGATSPGALVTATPGTFTYTVTASSSDTQTGTASITYIVAADPTAVITLPATGQTYAVAITVVNNTGAVTFVTTESSNGLRVSSAGVFTTTGALVAGSYTVSGTAIGNTGSWTYTLTVSKRTVTVIFNANGGKGTMAAQRDSTRKALTTNRFTRAGYSFTKWNTAANGSGVSFANGATYSFKSKTTLYAQWKKVPEAPPRVVTFAANGGAGKMASEHHRTPTTLTRDHFRRIGYAFIGWSTAANGSGVSYANEAIYSFAESTTLYAQWKKNKKITPPPTKNTGPAIGPFALGSSTLSPALESQIQNVADEVKAKRDMQLALLGYGDKLTAAGERNNALVAKNIELGRMRAEAVVAYLQGRLAALGLKGWTISIGAAGSSQSEIAMVIATLS
jgi:uncharacterized repeat protein (TIGR02543 family)